MSFVDQKRGPSPTGIASAVIVQASIGVFVVAGLSVTQFVQKDDGREMDPIEYKLPPQPEPEPTPEPQTQQQPEVASQPPITQPVPPVDFSLPKVEYETTEFISDRPIVLKPRPEVEKPPAPPCAGAFVQSDLCQASQRSGCMAVRSRLQIGLGPSRTDRRGKFPARHLADRESDRLPDHRIDRAFRT